MSPIRALPAKENVFFVPEDSSGRISEWLRAPSKVLRETKSLPNPTLAASSDHVRRRRESSTAHDRAIFEHRLKNFVQLRTQLGGAVGPGAPRASRLLRAQGTRGRIPDEEFPNMFPTGDEIVEAEAFAPVRVKWAAPKPSAGLMLEVDARGAWREVVCARARL